MPNYEVLHNTHRTSDGEVHKPGSVVHLTEAQAQPFSFKLRRLPDEESPQLETVSSEIEITVAAETEEFETAMATAAVLEAVATPAARRLAGEAGLDLSTVRGTGRDGRVTAGDVRAAREG